ncbi:MAG: tRNA guanosine(15) transglycosylase TgtA [Halobacteriales archaeon]
MTGRFETRRWDGAARLGRLDLPGRERDLRTPALLPVINPNLDTVAPPDLVEEFDPEGLITNAYVIHRTPALRERALAEGVHDLLGVDRPVMTDSGSFQLATYGAVEATNAEIVDLQREIGADICTPIDLPTHPDASRGQAESDLETTLERIRGARERVGDDRLLAGPVQGGGHVDLRERAGRRARATGANVYPIGAVVPLLEDYRFAELVDVVVAAKRGLGPDAPVHLFGAGHPMMFALAVALGCDLFDSAAYALYARDGRYLTPSGTVHLDDLTALPCACPVCASTTPEALASAPEPDRERDLARHNLHVSFAELRRVRQAVHAGTLFELLEERARAHPAMLDGYRRLLDHDEFLERHDPAVKGTFHHVSGESARRPEVRRHHRRLRSWTPPATLELDVNGGGDAWRVIPPFGPIPPGLEHTYPLTAEVPERFDEAAYRAAVAGIRALLDGAGDVEATLVHDGWPASALDALPPTVTVRRTEA